MDSVGPLFVFNQLGERRADPVNVVQRKIVHGGTAKLVVEKEALGVVFAPDHDVAQLQYLETGQPVGVERLAREGFGVRYYEAGYVLQIIWGDRGCFIQGLADMKSRRRYEVRQCFISDGPACAQDVALEAARADYWWKGQSYQRVAGTMI